MKIIILGIFLGFFMQIAPGDPEEDQKYYELLKKSYEFIADCKKKAENERSNCCIQIIDAADTKNLDKLTNPCRKELGLE